MNKFYLKQNIKAEPFMWKWYAWAQLIPPATAACNIVERHLKIMQSYMQNPQIHSQAIKDPKLLGGPFIDLNGEKLEEIRELITETERECEKFIILNKAIKDLDRILLNEGKGDSLEPFYSKVPAALKGLVELVYDLNNHPSIRLIEPLLYKKYYKDTNQAMGFSNINQDFRKFILSTPYLPDEQQVYINIPFADPRLDDFFKMKVNGESLSKIKNLFEISNNQHELFESFFTDVPPIMKEDRHFQGKGVRLRYFGHACVLIQTKSVSILIDPAISYPLKESSIARYTYEDLPDFIDYVLITHNHQDHLMFETLLQLRHKIGSIVCPLNINGALQDPSIKLILQTIGFSSVIELKEMESISLKDGEIIGIPFLGEHSDLNIQSKLSYCLNLQNEKILFVADSNNLDSALYDNIHSIIGNVPTIFLGMECEGAPLTWLYGPFLTQPLKRSYDRNRALSGSNSIKAWQMIERFKCRRAYVYAMGQEPWLSYVMALKYSEDSPQIIESNKLIQACLENGIQSERLFGCKEWIVT